MMSITISVINSEAKNDNHTPFIPHNPDMMIAQIVIATAPRNNEAMEAFLARSVEEK